MRTVAEIRDRLLEQLRFAVWRPSMYFGGNTDAAEEMLLHLLDTLCFIDGREDAWGVARGTYVTGCRWVRGHFEFQHRPFFTFVNEVASVYAEVAFSLGYFKPGKLLTEAEMSRLASVVRGPEFLSRDWTESELHKQFGPPSHEVVGGPTTVACYGCERAGVNWVHFDLARSFPAWEDWLPEPVVRDFRNGLTNNMHLLPFGQRWANGESATVPGLTRPAEPGAADGPSASV
jgi:hypothetical protein